MRATASSGAQSPFFVLGSPRSGTTLLRTVLCSHPDIFIPPENGSFLPMIRVFMSNRHADWDRVVDSVLDSFREGYEFAQWKLDLESIAQSAKALPTQDRSLAGLIEHLYGKYGETHAPGKSVWGDKSTPGDYHYLGKLSLVFPDARYVHIVRDGRDCVASSVRAGFFDNSYYTAAYAWRDNVHFCRRFGEQLGPDRFVQIRYEDLVSELRDALDGLCRFLGVEPSDAMLEHHRSVSSTTPDVERLGHHENVRRPISTSSLGKWRTQIPSSEIEVVSRIVDGEMRACGYQH